MVAGDCMLAGFPVSTLKRTTITHQQKAISMGFPWWADIGFPVVTLKRFTIGPPANYYWNGICWWVDSGPRLNACLV